MQISDFVVPDWRQFLQWHSVRISALGASVAGAWLLLTEEQRAAVLQVLGIDPAAAVAITFVAVIVGRLANQQGAATDSANASKE
jgi:hypothetical protein